MVHTSSLKAASSNYNKIVLCRVKSKCYKIDKITTATSTRQFWKVAFPIFKFVPPSSLIKEGLERFWAKFCSSPATSLNKRGGRQSRTPAPSTTDLLSSSPAAEERPRVSPEHKWEYLNLDGSPAIKPSVLMILWNTPVSCDCVSKQFPRHYSNKALSIFWLHQNKKNQTKDSAKTSTDFHGFRTSLSVLIMAH